MCKIIPKEEGCADGWVGMPSSAAAVPHSLLPSADPTLKAALKNLSSIRDISLAPLPRFQSSLQSSYHRLI